MTSGGNCTALMAMPKPGIDKASFHEETCCVLYHSEGCSHHADVAVTAAPSFSNRKQWLPLFQGIPLPFLGILPLPFCCPGLVAVDTCCNCGKHLGGTLDLLLLPAPSSARRKEDCLKTSLPLVIICQLRQSNNLSREHLFLSCRALFFLSCVPELFQCSLLYSVSLLLDSVPHPLCPSSLTLSSPAHKRYQQIQILNILELHCIALPCLASLRLALHCILSLIFENNTLQQPIYH